MKTKVLIVIIIATILSAINVSLLTAERENGYTLPFLFKVAVADEESSGPSDPVWMKVEQVLSVENTYYDIPCGDGKVKHCVKTVKEIYVSCIYIGNGGTSCYPGPNTITTTFCGNCVYL